MKIRMHSEDDPIDLPLQRWRHAIVGDAIDTRGRSVAKFVAENSDFVHCLRYNPREFTFELDGVVYSGEEPEIPFSSWEGAIVLEATTLGFVEILLSCRGIKQVGRGAVEILYTEPGNYNRPLGELIHRRSFDLSEEVEVFVGVPGNSVLLLPDRPIKVAVFVGFEGQRLNRLLEQTSVPPSACSIIFGVPAFVPGWEMDAFANVLQVMKGEQLAGHTLFCGAQNVLACHKRLLQLYESCVDERLLVVPIGTKPHGIGAALFLCEHVDTGVVYDNPKRKADRSDNVGRWHLFEAEF